MIGLRDRWRACFRRALFFVSALALGGCVGAARGPVGPVVSPTGFVYELGTPPVPTQFSQTAALYLANDLFDRALERALLGVDSDPENPIHYMLAGLAYARLTQYDQADAMFTEAQRIYPAYELDIAPEREAVWIELFNAGVAAHAEGDVGRAIEVWEQAGNMWDLRPEASLNLAVLFVDEARWDDAIGAYQRAVASLERRTVTRVLSPEELQERQDLRMRTEESLIGLFLITQRFNEAEPLLRRHLERDPTSVRLRADLASVLQGLGRDQEATAIYSGLLSEPSLEAGVLLNIGIALYRANDFKTAAEAFRRLTRLRPESRDAWFNYTNALFAAESWESLASAGTRLTELDPLGENAGLIAARAHLELGDEQSAAEGLGRTESAPVHLEGLRLRASGGSTSLQGRVVGNAVEAGTSVHVRFTFYGPGGALGTERLTLLAPPEGERAGFEISFAGRATAYRYELLAPTSP